MANLTHNVSHYSSQHVPEQCVHKKHMLVTILFKLLAPNWGLRSCTSTILYPVSNDREREREEKLPYPHNMAHKIFI